jgi:hypothetical protein
MELTFWAKFIHTIREFRKTAYHHYGYHKSSLIKFLYYSLFNINTFVVFGINLDDDLPASDLEEDFRVIKPTEAQFDDLRKGLDLPREFYYDKIHGIRRCYLVLCGNEIAYIHWVYCKGDPNRFLCLSERTAELNYNTTIPKYRGQGLMGKMLRYIAIDLRTDGFRKAVGVTHEKNLPVLRAVSRAGWSEITRIKTIGPFNGKVRI